MDKLTYDALLATIHLWKRNAADPQNAKYHPDANALCQLFNIPASKVGAREVERCTGCPVRTATGAPQCRATPFCDARAYIDAYRKAGCLRRDAARACELHVAFLETLLPDFPESSD
jgi:hypothetical protein